MKTFEELSQKAKSSLTEDQIQHYVNIGLMQEGLVRPAVPLVEPEIEPTIETRELFVMGNLVFENFENAETARKLALGAAGTDYTVREVTIIEDEGYYLPETKPKQCATRKDVALVKQAFTNYNSVVSANKVRDKEYQKSLEAVERIEQAIRSDIYEAQLNDSKQSEIVETYNQFLTLSEGNSQVALNFMSKKHGHKEISAAFEYMGLPDPSNVVTDVLGGDSV